jgi:hypothetical protein
MERAPEESVHLPAGQLGQSWRAFGIGALSRFRHPSLPTLPFFNRLPTEIAMSAILAALKAGPL